MISPSPFQIKALPSFYAGVKFRSRLEARWARYFDILGLEWQYEPEGYQLASGNYCPDFLCKDGIYEFFVEVKPNEAGKKGVEQKLIDLARMTNNWVFCVVDFFCLFLSSSVLIDNFFQNMSTNLDLPVSKFFYFSLLNFFLFFLFLKSTRFKSYLKNSQFLYSITFLFFFCFFLVLTNSSLDSLVLFEFLTLCVLLYMVSTATTVGVNSGSNSTNIGTNIRYNSISYISNSFLNFFFFMFIFGALFFFFFILFLLYFLCVSRYNLVATVLPMYSFSNQFVVFFLVVLILKLASAPLHF